jgi:hypothetical protein
VTETATKARKRAPANAPAPATNGARPKPGDKNFDWAAEYPGEEVFVFTASDGTTVGLTKLGPKRRPKPGKLALLDEQNDGIKVLWYFLKLASSDTSRQVQAELDEEDYAAMAREWAEFAGIELGE